MTGIIIDDFVATPVTTTSAPVVFPLVDVDTFGVVFQLVSEFPDVGEKPVDATSTVSTTNLGGVPATVPEEGQTTNDDAEMAGGADMVIGVQYYNVNKHLKQISYYTGNFNFLNNIKMETVFNNNLIYNLHEKVSPVL